MLVGEKTRHTQNSRASVDSAATEDPGLTAGGFWGHLDLYVHDDFAVESQVVQSEEAARHTCKEHK